MQIFRGIHHPKLAPACAVTIGNFDGVHRGHQAMLALLRNEARHRALPSCVMTFEPHPRDFATSWWGTTFAMAPSVPVITLLCRAAGNNWALKWRG